MNVQHSALEDEWHTPQYIVDLVRSVLGEIDLDPASSQTANRIVGARNILTAQDDGLAARWSDFCDGGRPITVYCNPPGGRIGSRSKAKLFWEKLMAFRAGGKLEHAIFMAFSAEFLQTSQNLDCPPALDFPICIPRRRIPFLRSDGSTGAAPSHSNAIIYVDGEKNLASDFHEVFSIIGVVKL